MPKARIINRLFKKCDIVVLYADDGVSAYAGFRHNPWLECRMSRTSTDVLVNGRWWKIDPVEWEIKDRKGRVPTMHDISDKSRRPRHGQKETGCLQKTG